jgi:predicted nucleotidyltransferase
MSKFTDRRVEIAHPKRIILFGACAPGEITEVCDLDVLVV